MSEFPNLLFIQFLMSFSQIVYPNVFIALFFGKTFSYSGLTSIHLSSFHFLLVWFKSFLLQAKQSYFAASTGTQHNIFDRELSFSCGPRNGFSSLLSSGKISFNLLILCLHISSYKCLVQVSKSRWLYLIFKIAMKEPSFFMKTIVN